MNNNRLFWIVMGVLGVGLVILVFNDSAGQTAGVDNYDVARFVQLGALALVFGAAAFARGRPPGHTLRQLAVWLVIFLAVMVGYQFAEQSGWLPGQPSPSQEEPASTTAALVVGAAQFDGI